MSDLTISGGTAGGGSGDVVGPGSATDNAAVRFDGTTGKLLQDSVVIIGDTGVVTGITDLTISGSTLSNFINASGTLNNATGNEIAYTLDFTVNQTGTASAIGLKVNMTDTASPNTCYLLDLQKGASTKFRVDENGNLETSNITGTAGSGITIWGGTGAGADLILRSTSSGTTGNINIVHNILFDGTIFKTSASSFTIRDQINRDILVANATDLFINDLPVTIEQDVTITNTILITPPAGGGAQDSALTVTAAAHTSLPASTEYHDVLIDLNRTITWAAGDVALQRFLYIDSPVMTMPSVNTFTEAITVAIAGPPTILGGSAMQITTAIGFKMEQVSVPAGVSTGIGFVIYSPTTGGASTVSTGSFMDGNLGVNTLTPGTWLDVKIPSLSSAGNDIVCIDGTTRYAGMYVGGTSITTNPAGSGTSGFLLDFGWAPPSNTSFTISANQILLNLEGSVNLTSTGGQTGNSVVLSERGTAGTTTSSRAIVASFNTASGSSRATTTGRSILTSTSMQGGGAVTTYVGLDQTFTIGASTTLTTGHGVRINNPSNSGTITNFDAILIEDNTATVGTRKTSLRILGTNSHVRIVNDVMIGADSTPGHKLEVKDGNISITNTTNAGELRFYEPSAGANYTAFKAQAQAGDVTYTLPAADGSSGDFLSTNGSGTLSWTSAAGGSPHALLSATHSDTVASAVSRGSLIYGNSTPAWAELNIGSSGTVLKSDGTDVSWGTVAVPVTYMKTSGTTKDNNTMADDSVMSGMTLATNKYTFIGFFWVSAGSTTPDFKFQLTVNTSTVNDIRYFWHATIASGAVQEGFVTASATSSGIINVAASGQTYVRVTGSLDVTNAGTLDVEWAQNTTDAVNLVTMNRGSFFQLTVV